MGLTDFSIIRLTHYPIIWSFDYLSFLKNNLVIEWAIN